VALGRLIEAQGGHVLLAAPVERIVVRGGRAWGVALADGRVLSARAVVSGAHIRTTLRLLGEAAPAWARRRVGRVRADQSGGVVVRYALAALPDYTALPGGPGVQHGAIALICPDLGYVERAHAEARRGWPAREPALTVLTRSAVDATLAPPGRHLMSVWGQYAPYRLAGHQSWDEVGPRAAEAQLAVLARYAPNVRAAVLDRVIQTPAYLERELDLARGNPSHLDMTPGQMFGRRPVAGLGGYRGPVPGLYLTGASTHPGGGIFGAAGRNAAAAVLHDFARHG
jgi:phytoene dehydrogenase-like protein